MQSGPPSQGVGRLAGTTAFRAYRKRFPNKDNAFVARYDDSTKEAVLRGDHDALLKRAMARCHMKGLDIWTYGYKFVALDVSARTINTRLKELDATRHKKTWRAELRAEMDALEEEFGGERFLDDEGVENVVVEIGFREGEDEDVHDPDPCLLCRFSTDSDNVELEPLAPDDVRDWIAGRSPPEPVVEMEAEKVLPPVPEPPKPPPGAADARAQLDAAAKKRQRCDNPAKACAANTKRGRCGKKADAAERPNDVERDDESWARWAPFIDVAEGDARASAVCRDALRAAIGGGALLDLAKVKTLLPRRLKPFTPQNPPRGGVPSERPRQLSRIGLARFAVVGDPDRTKMKLVVDYLRELVNGLTFVGNFGDGDGARAWIAPGVMAGRRRANCTTICFGHCSDGALSPHKKAVLAFLAGAADEASGELEAALLWFIDFIKNCFATRTVDLELVLYGPGQEGNVHDDKEEPTKSRNGVVVAGTVELRAACSVDGDRIDVDPRQARPPRDAPAHDRYRRGLRRRRAHAPARHRQAPERRRHAARATLSSRSGDAQRRLRAHVAGRAPLRARRHRAVLDAPRSRHKRFMALYHWLAATPVSYIS